MRQEKESIVYFEEEYEGESRYSTDGIIVYSIPEDCSSYRLREGCRVLDLRGRESSVRELIFPSSFTSFSVESLSCLPNLRKITSCSEFVCFSGEGICEHDLERIFKGTRLEEIVVLPWLVEEYKRRFGYWEGFSEAIVEVTALSDECAYRNLKVNANGFVTTNDGRTLIKVTNNPKTIEIPKEIERVAATAFKEYNAIEQITILGNPDDYNKDRNRSLHFAKDTANTLCNVERLILQTPEIDDFHEVMVNLKTVVYPLWNYKHLCFTGYKAESSDINGFKVRAQNFSNVELVEDNGIIYTRDGKFLVSGVDCMADVVHIKEGVEEIFQYAFCCNNSIKEVYIPSSVRKIGDGAFRACRKLGKVIYNFESVMANKLECPFNTFSPSLHMYLPKTRISQLLNDRFDNITIHTLPYFQGDICIDENSGFVFDAHKRVFAGILQERVSEIKHLFLNGSFVEISDHAFDSLESLEDITYLKDVSAKSIFYKAGKCSKLKSITTLNDKINVVDGVVYSGDFKTIIEVPSTVEITAFVCRDGVESIESKAFEGHKELKHLQLPATIKKIGDRAFACTGITEILFVESLESVGKELFDVCTLSKVEYEGKIITDTETFKGSEFLSSSVIKIKKKYKKEFVGKYPLLKCYVKTPMPKWLNWLE